MRGFPPKHLETTKIHYKIMHKYFLINISQIDISQINIFSEGRHASQFLRGFPPQILETIKIFYQTAHAKVKKTCLRGRDT